MSIKYEKTNNIFYSKRQEDNVINEILYSYEVYLIKISEKYLFTMLNVLFG